MLGIAILILFTLFLIFAFPRILYKQQKPQEHSAKYTAQMKKLWEVAQTSMRERKPLRAEKALLTILKFDEKNAAAYNRLGILYAKAQKYDEAIECFEIAQSLDGNPSSLHNAGLIYLETGSFEKAAIAFEQAIAAEGDVPTRYIALAKAQEKLGNYKEAVAALESAYEIDCSTTTLRQILALHEANGNNEGIVSVTARIEAQMAADAKKRKARQNRLARANAHRPTRAVPPKPAKKPTANPRRVI